MKRDQALSNKPGPYCISYSSFGKRSILFFFLYFLICTYSFSQNSYYIKGSVADSAAGTPLVFATITVFKSNDTSIINYRLTDPQGEFRVPNLPSNTPLRVIISYSGYDVFRKEFELSSTQNFIDFGTIKLNRDIRSLDEVLVFAERPPVIVRNDTIEFNATSFRTLPDALVEDLLKKLPGVTVDRNGNISVNGKIVNRILVDGKEFFGRDVRIATRNLPADVIDKVQVLDDKEQLEEHPYLDPSEIGKVINLKLKKGVKKGWFGKAYAGGGTDSRYELGGIANLFRDTLQLSVIGFSNNINKPGFGLSDLKDIGGFSRSGYSSSMVSSSGGVALDGISFGATGEGIQRSTGAGINMNTELSAKQSLNLRYFFGAMKSEYRSFKDASQFLDDTILHSIESFNKNNKEKYHKFGGTLKWKTGKTTNLTIRPAISLGNNRVNSLAEINTIHNIKGLLSNSENNNNDRIDPDAFSNDIFFRKSFNKAGKTFSINLNYYKANNKKQQLTRATSNYYNGSTMTVTLDQLRKLNTPEDRSLLNLTYQFPISKRSYLQFSNSTTIANYEHDQSSLKKDAGSGKYTIIDPLYTNRIERTSYNNTISATAILTIKKLRLMPKLAYQYQQFKNDFTQPDLGDQTYNYFLPGVALSWNGIFLNYFTAVTEPRISELQLMGDNTNPLYIRSGNPYLKPSKANSIYLTYDKYDQKRLITYRNLFSSIFYRNGTVYQRLVDADGAQSLVPVNANGINSYRGNFGITKQVKMINKWDLTLEANIYSDYMKTKVLVNDKSAVLRNYSFRPSFRYEINIHDKIEFNQEYTIRYNRGKYSDDFFRNNSITTQHLSSELVLRVIGNVVMESFLDYYHNPSTNSQIRENNYIWNASINFLMLKDKRGNLKLTCFDLLDQNRNNTRLITENILVEEQVSTLTRFLMLSFTYNIRNVKTRKVGGKDRLLRF